MDSQQYFSFMEKMTRKLAETFQELNDLCVQQITKMKENTQIPQQPPKPVLPPEQSKEAPAPNLIELDSPQEEPQMKSPKTKKIKKDNVAEEEEKESEDHKVKRKAKKVSHKPKAPASSFLLFFKDVQNSLAQSYPTYGVTEHTKVAAKLWSELSPQQKEPYIKLCDEERKVYQQKMQQYRIDFPHEIAEKEKDRQLKKEKKQGSKDTPKKEKSTKTIAQEVKQTVAAPGAQKVIAEEDQSQSPSVVDQNEEDSLGMV